MNRLKDSSGFLISYISGILEVGLVYIIFVLTINASTVLNLAQCFNYLTPCYKQFRLQTLFGSYFRFGFEEQFLWICLVNSFQNLLSGNLLEKNSFFGKHYKDVKISKITSAKKMIEIWKQCMFSLEYLHLKLDE